ncbi:MAG: branched-chain amino acid ABC transporter substrate-binding protein [Elusimicrobia bacterium]|nr:branched-chain amino acid ABC transporter substrate-binding protein [Elusimicrobiota bacterium]
MGRTRRSAVVALAALGACAKPPATYKLAVIAPLSGDMAADGQGMERAVELAVSDDAASSASPVKVEVVGFDDRAVPSAAAEAARKAAADPQVFAVIGPMTSGCAIEAARVLSLNPMPMITPSATAPELTLQQERSDWGGARVAFRLPPSDALQGESDAEYARQRLGLKTFAVISDGTPYGLGLTDAFRRGFEARSGGISFLTTVPRGAEDFSPVVRQIVDMKPDGVFFGGIYIDAGRLLKQVRAAGYAGIFMSGDGAKSDDLFRYAGDAADGAYLSVSGVPLELLPSAQDFVARYNKRWPDAAPRTFDHYAYEAARIALWALRKTGGDRKAAVEAIRSHSHKAMMGNFIFDGKGDSLKSQITMMKADGKRRRFDPAY